MHSEQSMLTELQKLIKSFVHKLLYMNVMHELLKLNWIYNNTISHLSIMQLINYFLSDSALTTNLWFGSGCAHVGQLLLYNIQDDLLTLHASWTFGFLKTIDRGQQGATNEHKSSPLKDRKNYISKKMSIR